MSPRSEEQFMEMRESRKSLILETALELFATNGYYATSISLIAKNAGISKGLMYNYFSSKEELIQVIIFTGIDKLMQGFDPNHDGILTKEELLFFIEDSFRKIKENHIYWKLYFSVMLQPSVFKLVEDKLIELLEPMLNMLKTYFKEQGAENPEAEAMFFVSMLDGVSIYYIMNFDEFPLEDIKNKILNMYK